MDFAWLYGKWKLFSLLFAKPHTHYSVTARVSELLQNQVTHQFHYFICCVKVRHKKTLEKTWPCPTCPISQTPGMFSVNFFLDARSYYVFNIHTRKGNKTSVKSFPSGILKGKLSLATHTHTLTHPWKWNKSKNDCPDWLSHICVLVNHWGYACGLSSNELTTEETTSWGSICISFFPSRGKQEVEWKLRFWILWFWGLQWNRWTRKGRPES